MHFLSFKYVSTGENITNVYSNFGQYHGKNDKKYCAIIYSRSNGIWMDMDCAANHYYICQQDMLGKVLSNIDTIK